MSIQGIILLVPALLFAISVHEFAHGFVAYRLGDPTPKYQGRLTLDPRAHIDPMGALMLLLFRFGWAKPVQVNPSYFKDQRQGMAMVALAGPAANFISAYVFLLTVNILPSMFSPQVGIVLYQFLLLNMQLNLGLAAFNFLPIPPLDGSKILAWLLPARYGFSFRRLEMYGPVILLLLLATGMVGRLISPILSVLRYLLFSLPRFR
ncbi:MAG: site-2 protease family protein [Firmicutes bacterium]|nr:site-2 protease family protein [Bacillota bacterium]